MEIFHETKVVTRNFLWDMLEKVRNMFGLNLKTYEEMIDEASDEILEDIEKKYDVDWFRIDTDPISNGAVIVKIYGQGSEINE